MKRNLLPMLALVGAIIIVCFSSFYQQSEFKLYPDAATSRYAVYDGSGPQNDPANYPAYASMPTVFVPCTTTATVLCQFRIDDKDDDNDIDVHDFNASFEALDVSNDESNSLDDESEIASQLDKKQ